MGRVVGLDFGSKRIGVAVSDELGILATPRGAILRTNLHSDLAAVSDLVAHTEAERVVVGYPVGMSGRVTRQTLQTEKFAEYLSKQIAVPVELWDERLTTSMAVELVGTGRQARESGRRDAVAAAFILQGYLDRRQ
jgi:putative Holliday junction resolvase